VNLISWAGHIYEITGNKSEETYLPPALWNIVHSEVMRQCDGLDGAQDNLIEDPDLCHPTFENIMCPSDNKSNNGSLSCITEAQANTVIQLMSPYYNTDGSMLFPGMQPGSETVSSALLYTGVPTPYAKEWFRYVVYNDTNWDPTTFNIKDAQAALKQNPFNIQTWEGDLSRFQNAGGKIITYHGMQDFLVSSFNSREYYKHVHETMGLAPDQLDEFYRYFRISGMAHCYYGDGASYIGGSAPSAYSDDPEDNVLMAMVEWVEKGIAPEFIRGTKLDQDGHPQYTRKHCRYPRRNVYRGPGSYFDENAWECVP
jgi:feruloyl esterase